MNFLIVIPTLGKRKAMARLINSIKQQGCQSVEIVVVNQGDEKSLISQLFGFEDADLRVIHTNPGVSHARNIGLLSAQSKWDVVAFIDDDCWYDLQVFQTVEEAFANGADACSTRVVTNDESQGSRVPFGQRSIWLDQRTVWTHAMESGSFFRRAYIQDVGCFDEHLGLGAATPWQSGEGTDLLLRGLERGHRIAYLPSAVVWEDPMPSLQHAAWMVRKRRYARGTGRVVALRETALGKSIFLLRTVARVLLGVRSMSPRRTALDLQVLVGRLEGLTGRVLSD